MIGNEHLARWKTAKQAVSREMHCDLKDVEKFYMPAWWKSVKLESAEAVNEGILILARSIQALPSKLVREHTVVFRSQIDVKCKGSGTEKWDKQAAARSFGASVAKNLIEIAEAGTIEKVSANELRERVLSEFDAINLESLSEVAWQLGIPVVHSGNTPAQKPHAIAVNSEERFAVVLMRNKRHEGWLLFDLAHELGHIMLGHLASNTIRSEESDGAWDQVEEDQANDYAYELLTGSTDRLKTDQTFSARQLLEVSSRNAPRFHVTPQWIIVVVGSIWNDPIGWRTVTSALNGRWPNDDAPATLRSLARRELVSREVSSSDLELLEQFGAI